MNSRLIVIDGKTYKSVNEMPPDVRQNYEQAMNSLKDQNGNRVPDAFESMNPHADKDENGQPDVFENMTSNSVGASNMKIIVDGKEFNGSEDLPPEARAKYEQAMNKLDANRNGVPDFLEGMINTPKQALNVSTSFGTETPSRASRQPLPTSPMITPDTSSGWMLALAGLFLFLLCVAGAAAVWYLFLRG
jgi:hypothetical protein